MVLLIEFFFGDALDVDFGKGRDSTFYFIWSKLTNRIVIFNQSDT